MKIATWNVNSIRARRERLLRWLLAQKPDVVCLQETKVRDEEFPSLDLRAAGYHSAIHGQKTYNGVAILSLEKPEDVESGLGGEVDDPQARAISARVGGVRVMSAYVPNGREVGSEAYDYKLEWLRRLRACLDRDHTPSEPVVVCGDFNVAPEARDVADPPAWEGSVLFHPEVREALQGVLSWGLTDVFRQHHDEPGLYSWWDYRMLAFPKNKGLRIDHIFASQPLASRCTAAFIDRNERKGKQPSDHAPVVASFDV
jgi:exodeoxyribonuclease-3